MEKGDVQKIKEKLRQGDIEMIGKLTGFTTDYAYKVLIGERNNDKIIEASKALIGSREALIKSFKK